MHKYTNKMNSNSLTIGTTVRLITDHEEHRGKHFLVEGVHGALIRVSWQKRIYYFYDSELEVSNLNTNIMTLDESRQLFLDINKFLSEKGFINDDPIDFQKGKYNYKGEYMIFNCPHYCGSVRLFKARGEGFGFMEDVKIRKIAPYELNTQLAFDFINSVIEKYGL